MLCWYALNRLQDRVVNRWSTAAGTSTGSWRSLSTYEYFHFCNLSLPANHVHHGSRILVTDVPRGHHWPRCSLLANHCNKSGGAGISPGYPHPHSYFEYSTYLAQHVWGVAAIGFLLIFWYWVGIASPQSSIFTCLAVYSLEPGGSRLTVWRFLLGELCLGFRVRDQALGFRGLKSREASSAARYPTLPLGPVVSKVGIRLPSRPRVPNSSRVPGSLWLIKMMRQCSPQGVLRCPVRRRPSARCAAARPSPGGSSPKVPRPASCKASRRPPPHHSQTCSCA